MSLGRTWQRRESVKLDADERFHLSSTPEMETRTTLRLLSDDEPPRDDLAILLSSWGWDGQVYRVRVVGVGTTNAAASSSPP